MSPWLRLADLMEQVRVSRSTIHRWLRQGLPRHKVGRIVLFDLQEVEEWIRQRAVRAERPRGKYRR